MLGHCQVRRVTNPEKKRDFPLLHNYARDAGIVPHSDILSIRARFARMIHKVRCYQIIQTTSKPLIPHHYFPIHFGGDQKIARRPLSTSPDLAARPHTLNTADDIANVP